eukprot:2207930-Amphidinium_carterae.3
MTGQKSPHSAVCNPMGRRGGSTMPSGVDRTAQRSTQKSNACAMHSNPLCTPDCYGSRLSFKAWTSTR